MAHSHVYTEKIVIGGVTVKSQATTLTAGQKISIDEAIAIANDVLVALSVDVSQVKGCFIHCDQNVTLETNSSSAPAATLAIIANIPYVWYTSKYDPLWCIGADITALYVTNASAAVANLLIEFLIDPTV